MTAIKFKYTGRAGAFINGVPARDLTEEDWAGLDKDQRMMVKASSLYKEVEAKSIKAEAEAKASGSTETRAGTSPAPTEDEEDS